MYGNKLTGSLVGAEDDEAHAKWTEEQARRDGKVA